MLNEREKFKGNGFGKLNASFDFHLMNQNQSSFNLLNSPFAQKENQSTKVKHIQNSNSDKGNKADNNFEVLETPKFCKKNDKSLLNSGSNGIIPFNNLRNEYFGSENKSNQENEVQLDKVLSMIEEAKKLHSFVPTNCTFNVFINTAELIHRKFFQSFFDKIIGKIFSYEKDQNNLIKLDSIYMVFIYLRKLKNYLFVETNKSYFSNSMLNTTTTDNHP